MRIGIYCNNYKPEDGGANSLVSTIISEIKEDKNHRFEYVFICAVKNDIPYKRNVDGYTWYNINYKRRISIDFLSRLSRALCVELTFALDDLVKKEKIDIVVFSSPFYTGIRSDFVFPIWDLGHRTTHYPEVATWYKKRGRDFMYRMMSSRAAYVLTGNETGKQEILKYYNVEDSKVKIVPFPVSHFCLGEESHPNFELPNSFFFYPAQFWQHKNHSVILNALIILREKYETRPIVYFTGSDHGTKKEIIREIHRLGLQNQVIITGFVKDEELKYLYTHATAMIFASMMGPNNLPPLEALYLGCPVIITDIEGHKEQMGDKALYFNGRDPESLARAMHSILSDKEIYEKYSMCGREIKEELQNYKYIDGIKKIITEMTSLGRL